MGRYCMERVKSAWNCFIIQEAEGCVTLKLRPNGSLMGLKRIQKVQKVHFKKWSIWDLPGDRVCI